MIKNGPLNVHQCEKNGLKEKVTTEISKLKINRWKIAGMTLNRGYLAGIQALT